MQILKWNHAYSVGNQILDTQHKRLIALLNELHVSIIKGREKQTLQHILDELVLYAMQHFKTEEEILKKSNYDNFEDHKNEHEALKKKAISLQSAYLAGEGPEIEEVMKFLSGWLEHHLQGSDRDYVGKII